MAQPKVTLIIHNVRSAWNVGSMFRTADAAGVGKIYICGYSPTPDNEKVKKTSLGAELMVPWEYCRLPARLIQKLKKDGYQVVALELGGDSVDYRKFKPKFPLALMVGNEVEGVSSALLKKCDAVVHIPMRGSKESLNVAVAFGIAAYGILS